MEIIIIIFALKLVITFSNQIIRRTNVMQIPLPLVNSHILEEPFKAPVLSFKVGLSMQFE